MREVLRRPRMVSSWSFLEATRYVESANKVMTRSTSRPKTAVCRRWQISGHMKHLITLIAILAAVQARAAWSAFAHVTPETEERYGLVVYVTQIEKDSFRIRLPAVGYDHKRAWLIIASDRLTEREQALRSYIWQSTKPPRPILVKAKLSPRQSSASSPKQGEPRYYEVELSSEMIKRAYIYIDFPSVVLDGGYFYSIDLPAYLARHKEGQMNSSRRAP